MKQKIKDISVKLFEKDGFSETSIQDIVNKLGVTKGTFYYYFESKEQLLMDIHLEYIEILLAKQTEIVKDTKLKAKEKIQAVIRLFIADFSDKAANGRIFFREMRHLNDENKQVIKEKRYLFKDNIQLILKEGIQSGEFKEDIHVEMITLAIIGTTNYSYIWFNPKGEVSSDQLSRIYSDLIMDGIAK